MNFREEIKQFMDLPSLIGATLGFVMGLLSWICPEHPIGTFLMQVVIGGFILFITFGTLFAVFTLAAAVIFDC